MSVRWMRPTDTLAADRESAVVCIVHDAEGPGASAAGLTALVQGTPPEVPLLLAGTRRSDELTQIAGDLDRELLAIEPQPGATLSDVLAGVGKVTAAADLVLLHSSCQVPSGWLERLRNAISSEGAIATVTPLSSDGGTVGMPSGTSGKPEVDIAAVSTGAHPRILIGGPHCLYVRRLALDLIGGFQGAHETLEAVSADLSERCLRAGMVNVVADDLYVTCVRPSSPAEPDLATGAQALREVDRSDDRSALSRSLLLASSTLGGLTVTIDARSLGPSMGGTQRYTGELVLALARFTDVTLRVVVAPDIAPEAAVELADAPRVEVISYEQAVAGVQKSHVVHRPQQVFSIGDLNLLALLGRRVVITHQDLIAYHNPTYHTTLEAFKQYRRITRLALAVADRVVFFSEHSRGDVQAEDLIGLERCDVVGAALAAEGHHAPVPPPAALSGDDFILCLGPNYRHKNRCFAIALVAALRAEQGWRGKLVLAGAHVPDGSSRADERELLAAGAVREAVVDLGRVDEGERAWLLANARAVVVPSVVEGFGLVPLEAAQAGVPCLFAAQSSLVEVLEPSLASLVPWDPSASAARVIALLTAGPQRSRHVEALRACAARWSWEQLAGGLVGSYERAMRSPYRAAAIHAWQELDRERYLLEIDRRRLAQERLLGELGIALASDQRFLTARQQRGLLRVGARPALARAVLWPFALVGSLRFDASDETSVTDDARGE
ncbi:MAG: glycosyltransferase [Solirubrobacteraceae bacterium]